MTIVLSRRWQTQDCEDIAQHLKWLLEHVEIVDQQLVRERDINADLIAACEAVIAAVNDDPSLQEELVISYFGGDDELPFARALRMTSAALAKAKGEPPTLEDE